MEPASSPRLESLTLLGFELDRGALQTARSRRGTRAFALIAATLVATMLVLGVAVCRRVSLREHHDTWEALDKAEAKFCSPQWQNCRKTKCCSVNGTRCYEKDSEYALCKPVCDPGPDPADSDNRSWSCRPLGPQKEGEFEGDAGKVAAWGGMGQPAAWVAEQCAADESESCIRSRCCQQPGTKCYLKDEGWAGCKVLCRPGTDPTDTNDMFHKWDCQALGGRTPGAYDWPSFKAAPWVATRCSGDHENCKESGCCKTPGLRCFRKDKIWAQCLASCHPGPRVTDPDPKAWNCSALGARTPGRIPTLGNVWPRVQKHKWVQKRCAQSPTKENNWTGENCLPSKCCKDEGTQCYSRDKEYGQCMKSCTKWENRAPNSPMIDENGRPWECKKIGQRHPRKWGTPSLFCFSVFMPKTSENAIIRSQLDKGIGIFACDLASLFTQGDEVRMGDGPDGAVRTVHFDFVPVGVSDDHSAANTGLFMNVWEAVRWGGKYNLCDWTIKADPDAVLFPDRMRQHVQWLPQGSFIENCPKWPAVVPIFGAVEALSRQALTNYYDNEATCRNLPWQVWGEDKWLFHCLTDTHGLPKMDTGEVGDALCLGQNCGDGKPAYHPLKKVESWMNCWFEASSSDQRR